MITIFYNITSTLYDSLFERYGESALKAIGFAMGEIWAPIAEIDSSKVYKVLLKKK